MAETKTNDNSITQGGAGPVPPDPIPIRVTSESVPIVKQARLLATDFEEAMAMESHLTTVNLPLNVRPRTLVWSVDVCPANLVSQREGTTDLQHTRISHLSQVFSQWCGAIRFRFYFTKAIFQQLKMLLVYTPGRLGRDVAKLQVESLANMHTRVIINPDNESEGIITVPFISTKNWHYMTEPTGCLSLWTLTPIIRSMDSVGDLPVLIFCNASDVGDGLRFRYVTDPLLGEITGSRYRPPHVAAFSESNSKDAAKTRKAHAALQAYAGRAIVTDQQLLSKVATRQSLEPMTYIGYISQDEVVTATVPFVAQSLAALGAVNTSSPVSSVATDRDANWFSAGALQTSEVAYLTSIDVGAVSYCRRFASIVLGHGVDGQFSIFVKYVSVSGLDFNAQILLAFWTSGGMGVAVTGGTPTFDVFENSPWAQWQATVLTSTKIPTPKEHIFARIAAIPMSQTHNFMITSLGHDLQRFVSDPVATHFPIYCAGQIEQWSIVKNHILGIAGNNDTFMIADAAHPQLALTQGPRSFQGGRQDTEPDVSRGIFEFFFSVFGGDPNSPWAKIASAADMFIQFAIPLFLAYDGTAAPSPIGNVLQFQSIAPEDWSTRSPIKMMSIPQAPLPVATYSRDHALPTLLFDDSVPSAEALVLKPEGKKHRRRRHFGSNRRARHRLKRIGRHESESTMGSSTDAFA